MRSKDIQLGPGLAVPIDVVTQTVAVLGIRGSGKTYTAAVMVEGALAAGQQVAVIDPTDVWWGLRSSADGKRAGFPILVAGGDHGDVPLSKSDGEVLADRSPAQFAESQWAAVSALKRSGGTFSTYKSRLKQAGLVVCDGGYWRASESAVEIYGDASRAPQTPGELREDWKQKLGGGPARMLDALVDAGGCLPRCELAEAVELAPGAGTFSTYLSRLTSNQLVRKTAGGLVLAEELME